MRSRIYYSLLVNYPMKVAENIHFPDYSDVIDFAREKVTDRLVPNGKNIGIYQRFMSYLLSKSSHSRRAETACGRRASLMRLKSTYTFCIL